ncbi:MAG: DUF934 domain-containing protein [Candidatus Rariloculaceae bacterium]
MALIKNNGLIEDAFVYVADDAELPEEGAVIVGLDRWQANREELLQRPDLVGLLLKSDQLPEEIGDGLDSLAVIALEFPAFRDGRAYSYARLLREKYSYFGELRAVGDVLLEQLHFMVRTGFDAFEIESDDPLRDFEVAAGDFSVWYQPTADGRDTAFELRRRAQPVVLSTSPTAEPKRAESAPAWRPFLARHA